MPLTRLSFEVEFHGPIRVGSGRAGRGLDDTVDREVVVPGSSLKGVMRAEAVALLGGGHSLVKRVFGTARQQSPWHWSDIRAVSNGTIEVAARIRIDDRTGTAADGALFLADHHWPTRETFEIVQFAPLTAADLREHEALLTASAAGVHSIGGDRNRGFGWVDVRRTDSVPGDALYDELERLMGAAR